MSSLQVRRPEDVGTPDSEAKGRNHPLYFVGTPRDSLLILMRRVMRNMMRHAMRDCVRTKRNTTRAGAWSMLFLPQPFTGLHKSRTTFTMNHQGERGAWQWLSRATSASYLNRQPSAIVIPHEQVTRKCKIMQICSYYVHFYSFIVPKWNLIQTCIVIQAHLPDFYNPPPLDADSVSRVSETYGITMDAALYRLFFTPSPHSRRFDTKDIEAPHSRSCAAALCW